MDIGPLLTLRASSFELTLAPGNGGSIIRFDHLTAGGQRTAILRPAERPDAGPLETAHFPMVPYCNRIRGGRFTFREREIVQVPNLAGDPSPLHGQGWLAPWEVVGQSQTEAILRFRHEPGEWPWRYEARQTFRLDERGLLLALSCRNVSDEPMPCGLGLHPYFPCTPDTVLDTHVTDVWTVDEHVLPVERRRADGRYDLRHRRICGQDLDNGYSGWGGKATIQDPHLPFTIRMSSSHAGYFQVYSPAEGGLFVAEPVTHANAVLNEPEEQWAALGMRVIEPDEQMVLETRLDIIPR
jgi:aldose 1-epimerase